MDIEKIDERLTRLEGVVEKLADHMVTFVEDVTRRFRETDELSRQSAERSRQIDERIDKLLSAIGVQP